MDRRGQSVFLLVAVVALAGCSIGSLSSGLSSDSDVHPGTVKLTIDNATELEDGSYELNASVLVPDSAIREDATIANVSVHGYSLKDQHLCSTPFGNLSKSATATLTCPRLPSLVFLESPERGTQPEWLEYNASLFFETHLYHGQQNGSHQYDHGLSQFGIRGDRRPSSPGIRREPTASEYQTMRCEQWLLSHTGSDFSTLENTPWLQWELRPPETERSFSIWVTNYTVLRQKGWAKHQDVQPPGNTTGPAPEAIEDDIAQMPQGEPTTVYNVTRSEFFAILEAFSGQSVSSVSDVGSAMSAVHGQRRNDDKRTELSVDQRVSCVESPPKHVNNYVQEVVTYVTYDGRKYKIRSGTVVRVGGRAFESVKYPAHRSRPTPYTT